MKIGVLGGSGQVGSEIVALASDVGYEVDAPRSSTIDIRSRDALERYYSSNPVDLIVNCAAYTAVDQAEGDFEQVFAVNDLGVANICSVASQLDVRVIHLSTDYVFDGECSVPYGEDVAPNPVSIYGKSKLKGELSVLNMGPRGVVLRVSWVFGASGSNFVKSILRRAQEIGELWVVDDQFGTPCSAKSIARAILRIANEDKWTAPLYHFGSHPSVSWYQFAERIVSCSRSRELLETEIVIHRIATGDLNLAAHRPANSILDTSLFESTFGTEMIPDWREELEVVLGELKMLASIGLESPW